MPPKNTMDEGRLKPFAFYPVGFVSLKPKAWNAKHFKKWLRKGRCPACGVESGSDHLEGCKAREQLIRGLKNRPRKLFNANYTPLKFKKKKVKLPESYPYFPYIQTFVKLIKGKKTPHFYLDLHEYEGLPSKYFDFYYEDIKGEFLVNYKIFGFHRAKVEIDYEGIFRIRN